MRKLLSFELLKKWKMNRGILIGGIIFQSFLLLCLKIIYSGKVNLAIIIISVLYSFSIIMMLCFPLIESIYHFNKDLSGKQSALELLIPITSWKKVLAKLIVSVASIILLNLIAFASILMLIAILTKSLKEIRMAFSEIISEIAASPVQYTTDLAYALFALASLIIVIYFCIALSKSISHKNKIAVPIGFGTFIAYCILSVLISDQLRKLSIITFKLWNENYSMVLVIFDIIVFALAFTGTSWLVEKKIES